jgi:hypothetical protein
MIMVIDNRLSVVVSLRPEPSLPVSPAMMLFLKAPLNGTHTLHYCIVIQMLVTTLVNLLLTVASCILNTILAKLMKNVANLNDPS